MVASPPSSRIMLAGSSSLQPATICSVHHQYSSSVSPLPGEDGNALRVLPACRSGRPRRQRQRVPSRRCCRRPSAPWRRRDERLDEHGRLDGHLERADDARAASAWASAYSRRIDIRPGISCSASSISLRPNAAWERSATLKSVSVRVGCSCAGGFRRRLRCGHAGAARSEPNGPNLTTVVSRFEQGPTRKSASEPERRPFG